jgi:hypothetical protein
VRVQAKEDASAEIAACEEIDKRRILAEVRSWRRLRPQACVQTPR